MDVETGAGSTGRNKKVLQRKERGCVPNLQCACPVDHDDGGCSYMALMVGRSRPNRRRRGLSGTLDEGKSNSVSGR